MARPEGGKFHRNELALLGAPCGTIQALSRRLAEALQGHFRLAYVDANHGQGESLHPFHAVYTDQISHHALQFHDEHIEFAFREALADADGVLVNGNHFTARRQLVLVNEQKADSLQRKLDRLTDVQMVVLDHGMEEVHPFLREHLSGRPEVPVFGIDQVEEMAALLAHGWAEQRPPVKGLVLAGGRSTRMGEDKGALDFHGKPQREHAADLLSRFCSETFLSVQEADPGFDSAYPFLVDGFRDLGPYGGLLTAFRHDPNSAWLVVACDMPLLDADTLQRLVEGRQPSRLATCFHNPDTGFPEPLLTLWEPRAYHRLLRFLALGYSCPRKVLINSEVQTLAASCQNALKNINTPEERDWARSKTRL